MASGCGSGNGDGLQTHPVSGTVRVDQQPAKGVRVRFYRQGGKAESNADMPVGVTDEAGCFQLSTNGPADGAVVGSYKATFLWPDVNGPGATDRLGGRYVDQTTSEFDVEVVAGNNDVATFRLTTDPQAAGAKRSGAPRRDADGRKL